MSSMRIIVDTTLCEGNGKCAAAAADVFRVDEEQDLVVVLVERPDESRRAAVERAARICPRAAITIAEE